MQNSVIVNFSKEEFEYIKEVIHNLAQVKIPKSLRSRKSEILKELNERFFN